ncbi:ATP-binding protein [Streptomyces sp. NPDC014006]|uniref:ATP-binding protein n=1 Tax=Streptomyces sp. NPDC014006 TaxID=3364870 RepID=UPI0036FC7D92
MVKAAVSERVPLGEGPTTPDARALQVTAALDGDGSVIARARPVVADFLTRVQAEHGLPVSRRAMEVTQLMVSELVTNARKYAPGPVLLEVRITRDAVEVAVRDSDPVLPVARAADAGRVGQHGLEIVMAVTQGLEVQRERAGKRVTARIALPDDPGGDLGGRTSVQGTGNLRAAR